MHPRLRAHWPETAIAEKVYAMVVQRSSNSRMRDNIDVYALAAHEPFVGDRLAAALRATFTRRRTVIPSELPLALTAAAASTDVEGKDAQWAGFLRRNRLTSAPTDLAAVVSGVARFIGPVLAAVREETPLNRHWPAGGPWA